MCKQVLTFLFGIFLWATITQSARLSYDSEDELGLEYPQQRRALSISNNELKTRGLMNDDQVLDKLFNSVNRRNWLSPYQTLKRKTESLSNQQSQFQKELLQAHNNYRSRHCVSPLQLDDELNRSAQQYAEKLARTNTFAHSNTPGVGENLWMTWSSAKIGSVNGKQPTDSWYSEIKYYDFNQGGFSMQTGHFTQLVWKDTQKVGAGLAYNGDRTKAYVVAQYAPPGNYEGEYEENVLPPKC